MSAILRQTAHRPWLLPSRPWSMFMRWTDLAFLHWPVPAEVLRPLLPRALSLDTYDGTAWLGVVPFRMEDTRVRWMPRLPTATTFPEVNVRTYVIAAGRAGVWFLSLDAASRLAVWGARALLALPYYHAAMTIGTGPDAVRYASRRIGWHGRDAAFRASYAPAGLVSHAAPGSFDHWLTERYCLFGQRPSGSVYYLDIHHLPWPLQPGTASIVENSLAEVAGVQLPPVAPVVHFAKALDVWAWAPVSFARSTRAPAS